MRLLLLSTSACHLCEQAQSIIAQCGLNIEIIDIAEQMQWQEEYALKIPVLYAPDTNKALCWVFDVNQVLAFIKSMQ